MKVPIYTIGYEKTNIVYFVHELRDANIEWLVDVRELPLSRKPHFSKKSLHKEVNNAGIKYMHLKVLGNPKHGREAAKAGDYDLMDKIFNEHMQTQAAQMALGYLSYMIMQNHRLCLMCFERDHEQCHRKIVAKQLSEHTSVPARHLVANSYRFRSSHHA